MIAHSCFEISFRCRQIMESATYQILHGRTGDQSWWLMAEGVGSGGSRRSQGPLIQCLADARARWEPKNIPGSATQWAPSSGA